MRILPTKLDGLLIMEPDVHRDARGYFLEFFNAREFAKLGIPGTFVQDNRSHSVQGVLRGLHGQLEHPQGKLVRAVTGEVFDVVVDLRPDSPTFRQWEAFKLSSENFRQVYIPPGFLHGFCVLTPMAEVEYKCSDFYLPGDEIGVVWNDPALGIEWPLKDPVLSAKDAGLPDLATVEKRLGGKGRGGNG